MKKLMMIPLVAVGMITMSGCSQSPVKETAKNDAINLANLDTTVAPGTDFLRKWGPDTLKERTARSFPFRQREIMCCMQEMRSDMRVPVAEDMEILLSAPQSWF